MKIVHYFFVGGAAAAFDISFFYLGAGIFGLPWFPTSIATFLVATTLNYFLSIRFVFESGVRFKSKRVELLGVVLVSTACLGINQAILYVAIEILQLHLLLAKCLATGIVFFFNYYGRKKLIF